LENDDLRRWFAPERCCGAFRARWAINRIAVETYVEKVFVPELKPGDIVFMDNLSSHKGPQVKAMIEAVGASLLYLPPNSPDFNPIENAFAKLRALLRKAAARTVQGLWAAIGRLIDTFTPAECRVRQLLRRSRIRCNLRGIRSSLPLKPFRSCGTAHEHDQCGRNRIPSCYEQWTIVGTM